MSSRLAIRSNYSLLWGVSSIEQIVSFLATQGCTHLGICEKNNLYSLHKVRSLSKKYNIKSIIGSELISNGESVFVFVASNYGYSRLTTLLTNLKTKKNFNLVKELKKDSKGLLLVIKTKSLLFKLNGYVESLYCAVTPNNFSLVSISKKLAVPLVAIDDATFVDQSQWEVHQVLRSIATSKNIGRLDAKECEDPLSILLTQNEYLKSFAPWPEALKEANKIGEIGSKVDPFINFTFPPYLHPNPKELLKMRVLKGAIEKYVNLSDEVVSRIDYELEIISKKEFTTYFLVMDEIVKLGTLSCGRGSAAASIVAYALGITNVDPIKHNLYFERFLNEEREDLPDIDVDFAWDERDDILHKVIAKFGISNFARVANHNHFNFDSAFRESAKAYGFTDFEISQKKNHHNNLKEDPLWEKVTSIALKLVNTPRLLSMHCGGVVITPHDINLYAPIENSKEGYPLLTWDKRGVEEAKLVKIDLLGNRSLAVIRDTLDSLKKEGIFIDKNYWNPNDDYLTKQALAAGDSMGVFYIESPAMRQLQRKSGKGDFNHVVIHSSMIRPAANSYINEYLRRLKGGKWENLDPKMDKLFDETYGILCYQEDVSKVAVALANFSEAEADKLRKIISKKDPSKLKEYEERFKKGCKEQDVKEEVANKVWQMILSFDGYSFCKAHSASYAMISFQAAYLKVHHKEHFMAAVLSNGGGYYTPSAYISEIRRMNINLIGPDVNKSDYTYKGENGSVVIGLMAIRNLFYKSALAIEKNRPYHSLEDFSQKIKLERKELVSLVASGAFDSLEPNLSRTEQLRELLLSEGSQQSGELFVVPKQKREFPFPVEQKSLKRVLFEEFESLGFLRNHFILKLWEEKIVRVEPTLAKNLHLYVGRSVTLVGWPITRKSVVTKGGQMMQFVSFEDQSDLFEAVIFPKVYSLYKNLLTIQRALIVRGFVQIEYNVISVEVKRLSLL